MVYNCFLIVLSRSVFCFLLAAVLTLAACDSGPAAPEASPKAIVGAEPASASTSSANAQPATYADRAPTFDAKLSEVSRRHVGFKGVLGAPDGDGMLALIGPEATLSASDLLADLAGVLRLDPGQLATDVLSDLAVSRPDFHVLHDVKTDLRRFLFETDLVVSLDLNEQTGRVEVGTRTAADADAVRSQMTESEIAVVDFVRAQPLNSFALTSETLSGPTPLAVRSAFSANSGNQTLRSLRSDAFRPLIAGAEVEYEWPNGVRSVCTQGPVVEYEDRTYGFLTNAHCTGDKSQITGVDFFQPTYAPADQIGDEHDEIDYRGGGWVDGIFITSGYYADIVFVKSTSNLNLRGEMAQAANCAVAGNDCVESAPPRSRHGFEVVPPRADYRVQDRGTLGHDGWTDYTDVLGPDRQYGRPDSVLEPR